MTIDPTAVQIPVDALDGQLATPREVVSWLNARSLKQATKTTGELHLYADGTNGDDGNNGLSASAPVQTLVRVMELIPDFVVHNVFVHLSGTFTDPGTAILRKVLMTSWVVFDGGDFDEGGWEVVAGPFTADGSSTSTIGDSGQSWTPDEFRGYAVEILTGAQAGGMRQIYGNDATTVTALQNFGGNPGSVQFQIIRPKTVIHGAAGYNYFKNASLMSGGRVSFQNLRITGDIYFGIEGGSGYTQVSGFVHEGANPCSFQGTDGLKNKVFTYNRPIDPTTWTFSTKDIRFGLSVLNAGTSVTAASGIMRDVVLKSFVGYSAMLQDLNAFRIDEAALYECMADGNTNPLSFDYSSTKRGTLGGGTGPGLLVKNCVAVQVQAINISDAGEFGIELDNSTLIIDGVLAGTGNTLGGVYAHSGAKVFTKSGSVPTITGNSVELSFDGSTQRANWATVNTTPQIEATTDLLVAKAR